MMKPSDLALDMPQTNNALWRGDGLRACQQSPSASDTPLTAMDSQNRRMTPAGSEAIIPEQRAQASDGQPQPVGRPPSRGNQQGCNKI